MRAAYLESVGIDTLMVVGVFAVLLAVIGIASKMIGKGEGHKQ